LDCSAANECRRCLATLCGVDSDALKRDAVKVNSDPVLCALWRGVFGFHGFGFGLLVA
jgi:hypothetical protein